MPCFSLLRLRAFQKVDYNMFRIRTRNRHAFGKVLAQLLAWPKQVMAVGQIQHQYEHLGQ